METTLMEKHTLPRSGLPPLSVRGSLVYQGSSKTNDKSRSLRWHNLRVYQAPEGFAAAVEYISTWEGEDNRHAAFVCRRKDDLAYLLQGHDAASDAAGYPPLPEYEGRQKRLKRDLKTGYESLVSEVCGALDISVSSAEALEVEARDLDRYRALLDGRLRELELTQGEASLICDALNGTWLLDDSWRHCVMEFEDAIRLNGLDKKWGVDAPAFLSAAREWDDADKLAICDAVERFWREHSESPTGEALLAVGLIAKTD